jgi:uncharacterized protein YggE
MFKEPEMKPGSIRRIATRLFVPVALIGVMALSQAPIGARAQATPEAISMTTATISVTGVGTVIVTPDTANIQIGVQVFNKELAAAQADATEQMNAIIKTVTDAGVAEKDIQTSNYSVSIRQQYNDQGFPTDVLGYDIYNTLSVTIRDLDSLGEILDKTVAAGANQIYGITFYTSDLTEATAAARKAAVQDAQERAGQLAAAAGVEIGSIVNISEGYSSSPSPIDYGKGYAADSMQAGAGAVPIQTGSQSVEISVSVTYSVNQ